MKSRHLFFSELNEKDLHFTPNSTFEELEQIVENLKNRYKDLENSLEEERNANVDERYEKEIEYLHKQLSYCPFQLNEKQYEKFNNFLRTHSHCRPDKKDSHYALYFSPSPIGIAADLQCKYCGDNIEIIGSEDW